MEPPKRIQRKRTKGWKMPPNTVYVGRPTKWGNPYRIGHDVTQSLAVAMFEDFINEDERGWALSDAAKNELHGKNLACFCRLDQPCHADVLLEIANAE